MVATAVMLSSPTKVDEVNASLSKAKLGSGDEVRGAGAGTCHTLAVGSGNFTGHGGESRLTGAVAPKGATYAEVVVATCSDPLVVRYRIGVISIGPQHGRPLVAIVGHKAAVTVHYPCHGGVEVER